MNSAIDTQKKYNTIDTANMHNNIHGSQGSNIAGGVATISQGPGGVHGAGIMHSGNQGIGHHGGQT